MLRFFIIYPWGSYNTGFQYPSLAKDFNNVVILQLCAYKNIAVIQIFWWFLYSTCIFQSLCLCDSKNVYIYIYIFFILFVLSKDGGLIGLLLSAVSLSLSSPVFQPASEICTRCPSSELNCSRVNKHAGSYSLSPNQFHPGVYLFFISFLCLGP